MARPSKRQRQARRQHASGVKLFNSGLIEDLLDVTIDPTYEPSDTVDSDGTDSEANSSNDMSFSLLDNSEVEEGSVDDGDSDESGEESDSDIICTGEKRKEALAQFEAEETGDYIEHCARQAAISAHRFWANIMSSGPKPAKLRQRELQHGARNNMKITSFFMPKPSAPTKDREPSVQPSIAPDHQDSTPPSRSSSTPPISSGDGSPLFMSNALSPSPVKLTFLQERTQYTSSRIRRQKVQVSPPLWSSGDDERWCAGQLNAESELAPSCRFPKRVTPIDKYGNSDKLRLKFTFWVDFEPGWPIFENLF